MDDYFSENPLYGEEIFRRRFRIILRIAIDLEQEYIYLTQSSDARGKRGFSPLQKCTSDIRQLAHDTVPDTQDEYLKMSERTSRECLEHFCYGIVQLYAREYLRKPTAR